MLRLAQRSSVLATSARLLASSSVVNQQERFASASTKKAVVFNMAGSVVPAMSPVLGRQAREHGLTEAELASKLFVDGDQDLMAKVEPYLLSKHGSFQHNLADVVAAVKSIKGEGLQTVLINDANGLNPDLIPLEEGLFDSVTSEFKPELLKMLATDPSQVVYVDNSDANLQAASAEGFVAVNFGEVEAALTELEGHLEVPLKEFLPNFSWIYYDNAHNPYKNGGENLLFTLFVIWVFTMAAHYSCKYVLKIDGTHEH